MYQSDLGSLILIGQYVPISLLIRVTLHGALLFAFFKYADDQHISELFISVSDSLVRIINCIFCHEFLIAVLKVDQFNIRFSNKPVWIRIFERIALEQESLNSMFFSMVIFTSDYDECTSSPCLNGGTCVNGKRNFKCICPGTHKGRTCEGKVR